MTATPTLQRFIAHLQAQNTHALGFLPTSAIADYVRRHQATVAYDNGAPCGYALWRTRRATSPPPLGTTTERTIIQLCIADDARRIRHATQVIEALADQAHAQGIPWLTLWCGSRLPAIRLWTAIGFHVIGQRRGGARHNPIHLKLAMALPAAVASETKHRTDSPPTLYIPPTYPNARSRRPQNDANKPVGK